MVETLSLPSIRGFTCFFSFQIHKFTRGKILFHVHERGKIVLYYYQQVSKSRMVNALISFFNQFNFHLVD